MSDAEKVCNRPYCNCVNVEPNFRSWYHTQEAIATSEKSIDEMATEMATFIAKTPCEGRCKALAQTKLQECLLWFKEGMKKEVSV